MADIALDPTWRNRPYQRIKATSVIIGGSTGRVYDLIKTEQMEAVNLAGIPMVTTDICECGPRERSRGYGTPSEKSVTCMALTNTSTTLRLPDMIPYDRKLLSLAWTKSPTSKRLEKPLCRLRFALCCLQGFQRRGAPIKSLHQDYRKH